MAENYKCPNCYDELMQVFHEASSVPVNSCILLGSREEALGYPKGDIALGFCPKCAFISNVAFDAGLTEYSGRYEETQGFSGTFNTFHRQIAQHLIDKYDLRGKSILEIGCGKGEFLMLLAELGDIRGTGFDPGYHDERNTGLHAQKITFVKDFYSEQYADYHADFVCCKMTLEHIGPTGDFVRMVRNAIGDRHQTIVFFQVPDTMRILQDCAFEDVYYEHCSYFSPGSLARLFRASGFEVTCLENQYDGQYLTIEARPISGVLEHSPFVVDKDLEQISDYVSEFPARLEEKMQFWRTKLNRKELGGKKVVVWGSGSKGVAFLTTLGLNEEVQYAVDINPYRHGYFMPGSGHEIVSPEFLVDYRPDLVVVMNSIYCDEIRDQLQTMGLTPEMIAI